MKRQLDYIVLHYAPEASNVANFWQYLLRQKEENYFHFILGPGFQLLPIRKEEENNPEDSQFGLQCLHIQLHQPNGSDDFLNILHGLLSAVKNKEVIARLKKECSGVSIIDKQTLQLAYELARTILQRPPMLRIIRRGDASQTEPENGPSLN